MDDLPSLPGTLIEVATILHEFGRADVTLVEACLRRLVSLLPQSASARRDAFDSGAAHAIIVAMGAHLGASGGDVASSAHLGASGGDVASGAHLGASGGDVASGAEVMPASALQVPTSALRAPCTASKLGCEALGHVAIGEQRYTRIATD